MPRRQTPQPVPRGAAKDDRRRDTRALAGRGDDREVDLRRARGAAPRTLVVYGAGWNQLPVLEASRRQGFRVIAVDRDGEAPGIAIADRFHLLSLRDHDRIEAALGDEAIGGVVARITDAEALASAQRLARSRGLPTACDRLVEAATSKRALARFARAAGIATPARVERSDRIDFTRGAVVVRPDVTMRGKAAIRRVCDQRALARAWEEAAALSASGGVDAARFVAGDDVSVLVALQSGRAQRWIVWDEWVAIDEGGAMHGLGCGLPTRYSRVLEGIDRVVGRIAAAVPTSRTLAVVSLRIDASGQPWLIEIHLGIGGDAIAERLLPAALPDWDVFAAWVELESGGEPMLPRGDPRPCAVVRCGEGAGMDRDDRLGGASAWSLIEAPTGRSLRERVRNAARSGWELPPGLRLAGDEG